MANMLKYQDWLQKLHPVKKNRSQKWHFSSETNPRHQCGYIGNYHNPVIG